MKHKLQRVMDNVANTFAVNRFASGDAGESSNSLLAPGTARIGRTHTTCVCARDPRVHQNEKQKAVVKSDTNAEGESFVGLHTLMSRIRLLGEAHERPGELVL
jgi:hypothetical protein